MRRRLSRGRPGRRPVRGRARPHKRRKIKRASGRAFPLKVGFRLS